MRDLLDARLSRRASLCLPPDARREPKASLALLRDARRAPKAPFPDLPASRRSQPAAFRPRTANGMSRSDAGGRVQDDGRLLPAAFRSVPAAPRQEKLREGPSKTHVVPAETTEGERERRSLECERREGPVGRRAVRNPSATSATAATSRAKLRRVSATQARRGCGGPRLFHERFADVAVLRLPCSPR
jgi:hypothetical protein